MYCGICIEVCPFDALYWSPGVRVRRVRHPGPAAREGPAARVDVDGTAAARPRPDAASRRRRRPTAARKAVSRMTVHRRLAAGRWARSRSAPAWRVVTHPARGARRRSGWWSRWARSPALYLVLAAELVAWVQVLLYVGAVVVLLLFAVMLTRAPIGASADLDRPGWAGCPGRRRRRARARRAVPRRVPVAPGATGRRSARRELTRRRGVPALGAALRGAVRAAAGRADRRDRGRPVRRTMRRSDLRPALDGADAPVIPYLIAALLFGLGVYGVLAGATRCCC